MLWLLMLFAVHVDYSGTWKAREPVVFTTPFETCEFRSVVAHVTHVGDRITGQYEAKVSCTESHWPDHQWRTRIGTLEATVDGSNLTISIDEGAFAFQATVDGTSITGTLDLPGGGDQTWTAGRVAH